MTTPVARKHLLLVCSRRVSDVATHLLAAAGHVVKSFEAIDDARTWLRIHRADLVIVDMRIDEASAVTGFINARRQSTLRPATPVLLLSSADRPEELRLLFQRCRLTHFVALTDDDQLDPGEFAVTVAKILTGDIFGLDRYLSPGARQVSRTLTRSSEKTEAADFAEAMAVEAGCHPHTAQAVAVAVDECLTNALYNAPVDASGAARHADVPRTTPVELHPGEQIALRLGFDGRKIGVSVRDPFGSLSPDRVVDYLARCFELEGPVEHKAGGAGLGMYTIFKHLHHFVVNVSPGRQTEIIGLVRAHRSFRRFSTERKSFNVFVSEVTP